MHNARTLLQYDVLEGAGFEEPAANSHEDDYQVLTMMKQRIKIGGLVKRSALQHNANKSALHKYAKPDQRDAVSGASMIGISRWQNGIL
jgi:hypothetical protein